jgi:hypothetical protein
MEIICHYYPGYGSVEKQFQARFGKKATIQPEPLPVSQEEIDKITNDPDLLEGIENHIPNIIKKIK